MLVREIMTRHPEYIGSNSTIRVALRKMHELDIRHLPVVDDGLVVGIVSDRDLKGFLLPVDELWDHRREVADRLNTAVSEIMQSDPLTVEPDAPISEMIELFLENRLGAIPVTDSADGRLVGIVSYIDILKAAAPLFQEEEQTPKDSGESAAAQ